MAGNKSASPAPELRGLPRLANICGTAAATTKGKHKQRQRVRYDGEQDEVQMYLRRLEDEDSFSSSSLCFSTTSNSSSLTLSSPEGSDSVLAPPELTAMESIELGENRMDESTASFAELSFAFHASFKSHHSPPLLRTTTARHHRATAGSASSADKLLEDDNGKQAAQVVALLLNERPARSGSMTIVHREVSATIPRKATLCITQDDASKPPVTATIGRPKRYGEITISDNRKGTGTIRSAARQQGSSTRSPKASLLTPMTQFLLLKRFIDATQLG